ncbi:MAG: YqgE/AlgH family protein [Bacteroidales bacterium]|nr:YqgE/AlgH family protein [Bacteroidales bacterium]
MSIEKHIRNMLRVKPSKLSPMAGRLLIAEPFMFDMYFRRTVVLLIDSSKEGSFGVVLNKPTFIKIKDVVDSFPDVDYPLYSGGPVDINNVYFLHRLSKIISDGSPVKDDVTWGGNKQEIIQILESNFFDDSQLRVFMGYSSWEPGQLETELKQKAWVVADFNPEIVFNTEPTKLWNTIVESMGTEYALWKNLPINPGLN